MATRPFDLLELPNRQAGNRVWLATWSDLAQGDDGQWLALPLHAIDSVQIEGVFGTNGNCRIEGSNDAVNGRVLHNPQGQDLDFTEPAINVVSEVTRLVRPRITDGDGNTNITVTMQFRRPG